MALYRVRPGFTHGLKDEYKAGDTLDLEPQQARGFADKLELVVIVETEQPEPVAPEIINDVAPTVFDVTGSTVSAVLAAVDGGVISAADALAVEMGNRNRATLVKALQELISVAISE